MKTKDEVTLDWTAKLLPMWEDPLSNDVQPITLKETKRPNKRTQVNWEEK